MTPGMLSQSNNQTTACESLVWQQIIVRLCIMSHRRTLCCPGLRLRAFDSEQSDIICRNKQLVELS